MIPLFTVEQYHRMIDAGILGENDDVELLEGYVVQKLPRDPRHAGTTQIVTKRLMAVLPGRWDIRIMCGVTLPDSEPEPDHAIVRGDDRNYATRHPGPSDIGLLIEVANSTLVTDREIKGRIYARANIPTYWIVNLVDNQIEVYTQPSGPTATPAYGHRQDFAPGASIPFSLDGTIVATIPVSDLLP